MRIKERNADSHIFLYAKNWYKKTNVFEDLRKIYAVRNACKAEYISDSSIVAMLCDLVFPYLTQHTFRSFILDLFRYEKSPYKKTASEKIANNFLSRLELTRVKDDAGNILIQLDAPDYSILPKKEK
jgi:hypothetical protein